jgi:hypothetical protein
MATVRSCFRRCGCLLRALSRFARNQGESQNAHLWSAANPVSGLGTGGTSDWYVSFATVYWRYPSSFSQPRCEPTPRKAEWVHPSVEFGF